MGVAKDVEEVGLVGMEGIEPTREPEPSRFTVCAACLNGLHPPYGNTDPNGYLLANVERFWVNGKCGTPVASIRSSTTAPFVNTSLKFLHNP